LLNIGAEYVWLDVLCLRQKGGEEDEAQRLEEWKTDIPTIGHIYHASPGDRPCIVYFNGLGLPLDTSQEVIASPTHWFNRVWTLQEGRPSWVPGGLPGHRLRGAKLFFNRVAALCDLPLERYGDLIESLMARSCTSELDRIAGMAYYLG
ncbi:hypothetical protein DPZ16_34415, partial [Klebsiella pneumoniae]